MAAKCDICGTYVEWSDGYLLTTAEVVLNHSYWEYLFGAMPVVHASPEEQNDRYIGIVKKCSSDPSGWLVCPKCSNMFNFDRKKARQYAIKVRGSRHPESAQVDFNEAWQYAKKAAFLGLVKGVYEIEKSKKSEKKWWQIWRRNNTHDDTPTRIENDNEKHGQPRDYSFMFKKCTNCGAKLKDGLIRCLECGCDRYVWENYAYCNYFDLSGNAIRKCNFYKKQWNDLSDLAKRLVSENIEIREKAMKFSRHRAGEGSSEGLDALEEAISYLHENKEIEFHIPNLIKNTDAKEFHEVSQNALKEIKELARLDLLWKTSPAHIQRLFSVSTVFSDPVSLIREVFELYGDQQAMALQLFGTHLAISGALVRRGKL
ncbi:MAG: hypothetical protein BA863_03820 [Desulfovibrio sp. S3730MH75]|nr:MAG: hypothetical protein BA863_03820 [Desulfovibrio sp. S3730MH75]